MRDRTTTIGNQQLDAVTSLNLKAFAARDSAAPELLPTPQQTDVTGAPPSFTDGLGRQIQFVDITHIDVSLDLNVENKTAATQARVEFNQPNTGYPVIELVPGVSAIRVDGEMLEPSQFEEILLPDGASAVRIIDRELTAGDHTLELSYGLTPEHIEFTDNGVRFFTAMNDRSARAYSEQFFPANLPYDTYSSTIDVKITGTDVAHQVVSNGEVETNPCNPNIFTVSTPADFTTHSLFLDIINPQEHVLEVFNYQSVYGQSIPVTVYAPTAAAAGSATKAIEESLRELEAGLGAYPHKALIARIDTDYTSKLTQIRPADVDLSTLVDMEYDGALTVSNLSSLSHELAHQWYGRSARPIDGNAAWIDEAVAMWAERGFPIRDENYGTEIAFEGSFPLSGFSPYHRTTPGASYFIGAGLINELAHLFRGNPEGGLQQVLREFHNQYAGKAYSNEQFVDFIVSYSNEEQSLRDFIEQRVYGTAQPDLPAPGSKS